MGTNEETIMKHPRPIQAIPPPAELECLKALWALGEGSVRAVQNQLEPRKKLAYTTVLTLLERLTLRGGVGRRKAGRAHFYVPLIDQETIRQKAIEALVDNLFDNSPPLLASYLDQPRSVKDSPSTYGERLDSSLL